MNEALFELFFMMVVLKLPIVYLCCVVWWAVRATPDPLEGAEVIARPAAPPCPWRRPGRRPIRPRGGSPGPRRARRARVAR